MLVQLPNIKFYENMFRGSGVFTYIYTEGRADGLNEAHRHRREDVENVTK
jgi:hypothetical protein